MLELHPKLFYSNQQYTYVNNFIHFACGHKLFAYSLLLFADFTFIMTLSHVDEEARGYREILWEFSDGAVTEFRKVVCEAAAGLNPAASF